MISVRWPAKQIADRIPGQMTIYECIAQAEKDKGNDGQRDKSSVRAPGDGDRPEK